MFLMRQRIIDRACDGEQWRYEVEKARIYHSSGVSGDVSNLVRKIEKSL